jgi:primosomal protein N' (replication factor Y) (superfamily II helicase)
VDWVAAYTLSPPGAVLRMAMSAPAALEPPPPQAGWQLRRRDPRGACGSPRRGERVLDLLGPGEVRSAPTSRRRPASRPAWCAGWPMPGCWCRRCCRGRAFPLPDPEHPGPVLGPDQAAAAAALREAVARALRRHAADRRHRLRQDRGLSRGDRRMPARRAARRWCCCRRSRCPRSGSTASAALRRGPALWHSELTPRTRRDTWRAVAEGEAPVLVGARSALFLPFPDLGLIVVDEEHETAFKQEDGVIYHARDMAVVRARLAGAACVLVSATPSLETLTNAETGRYAACTCRAPWRRDPAAVERSTCAATPAGARPLPRAAADRGGDATRWRAASRRCCSSTAAAMRR